MSKSRIARSSRATCADGRSSTAQARARSMLRSSPITLAAAMSCPATSPIIRLMSPEPSTTASYQSPPTLSRVAGGPILRRQGDAVDLGKLGQHRALEGRRRVHPLLQQQRALHRLRDVGCQCGDGDLVVLGERADIGPEQHERPERLTTDRERHERPRLADLRRCGEVRVDGVLVVTSRVEDRCAAQQRLADRVADVEGEGGVDRRRRPVLRRALHEPERLPVGADALGRHPERGDRLLDGDLGDRVGGVAQPEPGPHAAEGLQRDTLHGRGHLAEPER